jgi:hypothetical protein
LSIFSKKSVGTDRWDASSKSLEKNLLHFDMAVQKDIVKTVAASQVRNHSSSEEDSSDEEEHDFSILCSAVAIYTAMEDTHYLFFFFIYHPNIFRIFLM